MKVFGKLKDSQGNKYISHYVVISFWEEIKIGKIDETESTWKPSECRCEVGEEGDFALELPDKDRIKGPITLKVLAPDGEMLALEEYEIEDLEKEIEIEVDAKIFFEITPGDLSLGREVRITGRVLDVAGRQKVSNTQVILWGRLKGAEPEDFIPVVVSRTDKQGYFFGDYPRGDYEEAYGVVGIRDGEKTYIHLENGAFPKKVILAVEIPEEISEEPPCRAEVPRAPNSVDLVQSSSTYSNDLGGGKCVDFTAPNRTLEEFSFYSVVRTTEPEIKGLTLAEPKMMSPGIFEAIPYPMPNPINPKGGTSSGTENARKQSQILPEEGKDLDTSPGTEEPIPVLEKPMYINPGILKPLVSSPDSLTLETLKRAEMLTDYNDFINLLDLHRKKAPGRSKLTADNPVDWDDEPTFYQATTIAHGHLLHLKQVWKADGYSLGDLLYSLPLAPCQKKQIAVIDWDRRETATRFETLEEREQIDAMTSRDRDISEIVNSVLTEQVRGGSEAETWSAGGGGGAFFTIGCFSIGGGGGGGKSGSSSEAWQDSSRRIGASSLQQLHDRTMQSAAAVRNQRSTVIQLVRQGETMRVQTEVVANNNHCHAITNQYFEVLRHFQVSHELVDVQECLFIPLLMSRFDHAKALRWRESLRWFLRNRWLRRGFSAIERIENNYVGSDLPTGCYAEETLEDLDGELQIIFNISRPRDKDDDFDPDPWIFWGRLFGIDAEDVYNRYLKGQELKDLIFHEQVAPRIAEKVVQLLRFYAVDKNNNRIPLPVDSTLVSSYKDDVPLYVTLRLYDSLEPIKRENIKYIEIDAQTEIGGLWWIFDLLPPNSKMIVRSGSMRYRTKYMTSYLFRNNRILNDLTSEDSVRIPTPLNRQELRNPREEDKELAKRLIDHLNEHLEYYHKVIWMTMDRERRYMLLDGFDAPNSNGRSVASVVENRVIGIVGNCLVMPVARGFHLDPTFRQDVENPVDLLHLYAPDSPIPPMRISVPTRGVFAEAVKGACNSCEDIDDAKFWRWEESPCPDKPTPIQSISTESRRAEPGDLTAKDFPAPMINLQNIPAAPAPTGLAAALQLLGTPNLFKDITGLELNQRNALAALQASLDAAKFFGGKAAGLLQQNALKKDIGKTLQTIQKAEKNGLITKDDASRLTNSALSGMVGEEKQPQRHLTDEPEVQKLVRSASEAESSQVDLIRGSESVGVSQGVSEGGRARFNYNVPGIVPLIAQPKTKACWATAAAMMVGWRDQMSYSIEEVVEMAGADYLTKFKNNKGLYSSEKPLFLASLGLHSEPPMSYPVSAFLSLLKTNGPLWVTTDEDPGKAFAVHARIVTGMFGDGTTNGTFLRINDPDGGRQYTESYRDFVKKFEELSNKSIIQVVMF